MNDIDNTPEGTDSPPAAPPAPTFVPSDDFKAYQQTMQATLTEMAEGLRNLTTALGRQAPAPTVQTEARITKEQYAEALREGNVDVIDAYEEQRLAAFKGRHVDPLAATGSNALASLNRERLTTKPHYARYKREVDARLAELDPGVLANPIVIDRVYAMVVGEHADEIEATAREAAIRQATQPPAEPERAASPAGRASGGKGGSAALPTVAELLGDDAAEAIRSKGLDADTWAKRLGYKDGWAGYAKLIQSQQEA